MFEKYYGKCNILGGDKNFDLLIEYRYVLKKDKGYYGSCECSAFGFDPDEYSTVIIGKDIVTGTPVFSMLPHSYASTIEDAAKLRIIKKGKLIVKTFERVSIEDAADYLNKMTDEEAIEYVKKVDELKQMYSEEITREKFNFSVHKNSERIQKENLELGKDRVKRLVRNLNR